MKLIVGLGNPGSKYEGTRHNAGFEAVDRLARRWEVDLSREQFEGKFGLADFQGERVGLLKPWTFMNRSGRSVLSAGRFYKLHLADLMVVVDDLALPPGKIRVRPRGSAGNHNGLQDIIDRLGTLEWCRLRIGIGEAVGVPSVYVLSRFGQEERAMMNGAYDRAADALEHWIQHGPLETMNRFNRDAS